MSRECPHCGGNGVILLIDRTGCEPWEQGRRVGRKDCEHCNGAEQVGASQIRNMISARSMPQGYSYTLSDFDNLAPGMKRGKGLAIAAARVFAHQKGRMTSRQIYRQAGLRGGVDDERFGLVLTGNFGTGKTALAIATVNELLRRQIPTTYMKLSSWLSELIEAIREDEGRYQVVVDRARSVPMLAIDEFNMQKVTDHTLQAISDLIDHRAIKGLPYMVITNLNQTGFESQWGAFIASRVNSNCHWVDMGGPVFRTESPVLRDEDFGL